MLMMYLSPVLQRMLIIRRGVSSAARHRPRWHASERKGETGRFLVGEVRGFGLRGNAGTLPRRYVALEKQIWHHWWHHYWVAYFWIRALSTCWRDRNWTKQKMETRWKQ